MNGTQVTIKCDAIRGRMVITQDQQADDTYIINATNYQPYEVSGNSLGEVIDRALANIHQMKRTMEFRAKQMAASARREATMKANGTANKRGNRVKQNGQARKRTDPTLTTSQEINLDELTSPTAKAS